MRQLKRITFLLPLTIFTGALAWYDNRYLPLIQPPPILKEGRDSYFSGEFFALNAYSAIGPYDEEVGIPEIYGMYDQGKLAQSFVAVGCPNPLKSEWRGSTIPWYIDGTIKAQGCTFAYRQALTKHCQIGCVLYAMRLDSWEEFDLREDQVSFRLNPGDALALGQTRRYMHYLIGLCSDHSHQTGIGDIDFYFRLSNRWNYVVKCRSIYAGVRVGAIAPTAPKRNVAFPTWIPFGGDGHWGFYAALDAEFEVREDMKIGAMLRAGGRVGRTRVIRMPALEEPQQFGVVVGPMRIDPGATINIAPYVCAEGIREGLGLRVIYTLTAHEKDWFMDCRPDKFSVPANIKRLRRTSKWASDYFSINVFYDFGKTRVDDRVAPILTLCWDIPASVAVAERTSRTNRISCGISVNF